MAEHYPKSTVWVTKYCKKCDRQTRWNVMGGRIGACQSCLERLEAEANKPKPAPAPKQESLF